jgi:hypothetical protein
MSRRAGDPVRDFHRVDLLWTALVIAVAVGAIVGDQVSAAGGVAGAAAGALSAAASTSAERLRMLFDPAGAPARDADLARVRPRAVGPRGVDADRDALRRRVGAGVMAPCARVTR